MTDAQALRAALLDLLMQVPGQLLATPAGRDEVAIEYLRTADKVHPAVADVMREAAARIRDSL